MDVVERAIGRGELGFWVHQMITPREMRKSMPEKCLTCLTPVGGLIASIACNLLL